MWRPPSCVNVTAVVVTIFAVLCCMLLLAPTRNGTRGGGLVQPLVIVEETATEFHAAMVYVLPESGVADTAALSLAFRHVLGLAGRPDIVVVGAAAAVAGAAEAIHAATGCDVLFAPVPALAAAPPVGDSGCASSPYERTISSFLVSDLLTLPSLSHVSLVLLLHSLPTALADPVPCDPFQATHAAGAVYAKGGAGDAAAAAASPACAAGLKAAVEKEASSDKVQLSSQFAQWPEAAAPPPALQVLQVSRRSRCPR